MLRPSSSQILKNGESVYSLVIAVAKRAREILDDAYENKEVIDVKPVKTAVDQFANGEYRLIEDPSLKKTLKR
ncbi:MAG: DNA-directed RNA polymerase subunit omega [Oscillospiraceae bacterium]|nr:DNA-directed RNA polymerase subunit omega [Oscillospiraceae bacterium]MCD7785789.1 DNA-directed RNA polymerase subunit omega [Oscillospiraceae bacterium]